MHRPATRSVPGPVARSGAPLAAAQGFRHAFARLHGALSLLLLTNALCELPYLATPRARTGFAAALAVLLGRPVRIRGSEVREDAVVMARAALGAPGGREALVTSLRVLGGAQAADDLALLINAHG